MSTEDVEKMIREQGPRVQKAYGYAYFNGWKAGLRRSAGQAAQ